MKWKHRVVDLETRDDDRHIEEFLDHESEDGWELVSTLMNGKYDRLYLRKKIDE